VKEVGHSEGL